MQHKVIIAMGSNTRQVVHIEWASEWLSTLLSNVKLSRLLWTQDIKGTGLMYMNRLVSGYTLLSADEIEQVLKAAEARTGRSKPLVTLDLDLMQYDEQRYHLRDWPRPYIQRLIDEV